MLLTTRGVFRFDPETKELYLARIHPGVTVDEVRADVPWDLKVAPDLSETPPPTDVEIDFVRRFAPAQSAGRKLAVELTIGAVMERSRQRGKG